MRSRVTMLLPVTLFSTMMLGQASMLRSPEFPAALAAVAKAWSLPPAEGGDAGWPDARPEDLAAAAFLWKSGGPPPAEGWRLRQSEKSWEDAARKAGVPVDALLESYRRRVGQRERDALSAAGSEWVMWAELQTLERLTGRSLRALAAERATTEFGPMLEASMPAGGTAVGPPRPQPTGSSPASDAGTSMNPLQPALDRPPTSGGIIDTSPPPAAKGR